MTGLSSPRRRVLPAVAGVVACLLATALPPPAAASAGGRGYSAEIARASYGVPHITARDFAGLGFGIGHVQAEDDICILAERFVTVDGTRARYFGASGPADPNVASDLFYQKAKDDRSVERSLAGRPDGVHAPSRAARDLVRGFTAGYNTYLRDTGAAGVTDPACAGRPWVRQIGELDVWRSLWANLVRSGAGSLIPGIVTATPPAATPPAATLPAATLPAATLPAGARSVSAAVGDPAVASDGIGSNAYGLGRDATRQGTGMLLANPHFPWDGSDRFYRMHLRIPGVYDVEGASLLGQPVVNIGHNATLGWSHTVSTARRFVYHRLSLVPGDPTAYLFDGRPERMTARTVTVQVPVAGGGTAPVTRTLYDTRFGPVVANAAFPWTAGSAFAITDVNATNARSVDGWLRMGQADSVRELRGVLDRYQFLPWVNVIAADRAGEALYGDHSVIPRVTPQLAADCIPADFTARYASSGVAVLDGSTSACLLGADPDAAVPGILGPSRLPVSIRTDYVTNSNDSHWLANPADPLEGFSRIIGDERTARSLRTRLGLVQVQQRLAGTDGLPGTGFTTDNLWQVQFGNRVFGGELVRDDLVALCRAHPRAQTSDGATVDLTPACAALQGWDLRADVDSRGAHLFTQFTSAFGLRFADRFDPQDPVHTPRRLDVADPAVLTALADAVQSLAGIALDAPLGTVQTEPRGAERLPIPGGPGSTGTFNVITAPFQPGVGYPKVVHGTSFLMAVEFGADGPAGRQILTYSQSSNPNSPYYADQTRLYSGEGWDTIKYTAAQLAADPVVRRYTVTQAAR